MQELNNKDNNFDSLKKLYDHVETHAYDYKYLIEIGDLFQKFRDKSREQGDEENSILAQYELDAFNLMTKDGQLVAQFVGTDGDGNEVRIPDIDKFSSEELTYFEDRIKQDVNPRLQSRYAHILWQSPKKHQQNAVISINSYLEQVTYYINLIEDDSGDPPDGKVYHLDVLECAKSALWLAVTSNQELVKTVSKVWNIFEVASSSNQFHSSFIHDLIALILNNKKHFESRDLSTLAKTCLTVGDQLAEASDFHGAIRMNELGQLVDQRLSLNTAEWSRRNGECYETLMKRREKSPMVAAEWCQRAIDFYKLAGDKDKVEELTIKREEFGGQMEFQEVSTTIDQSEYIARCEEIGKKLSKQTTDELLGCIASDPNLLPLKQDMELHAAESAKSTPLLSLIAETVMDDRMHVAEHVVTPDEKLKRGILEGFKFYLKIEKVPLINAIMYHSFRAGKLDVEPVLKSLRENSWIGATLKSQRGSNKEYEYCWLDQLAQSIGVYFNYMKALLEGAEPDEPPIIAIDSLTLKFEGLVRDFAQLNGILTHYDTKDKVGRTITREKDLSLLLYDTRITDLFNPDDLLFFKFMFVEQSGFTLRHRVAHSLMLTEDYNFGILQLLFVALMRLAKYPISKIESKQ